MYISPFFLLQVTHATSEVQLLKDLFRDYNSLARPVLNHSSSIKVTVDIALRELLELVSGL